MSEKKIAVTFILPAHNESYCIQPALQSLVEQELDRIAMKIIVVPNGCTDDTAEKATSFSKTSPIPVEVLHTDKKGKAAAINVGRSATNDKFVIYGDSDCRFDKQAVSILVHNLQDTGNCVVTGGLDIPEFNHTDKPSFLQDIQRIMQIERVARGRVITHGRLVGLNQERIPTPLPENIHSEDVWMTLNAAKLYGFGAVKVDPEAKVYFHPPLTWADYLAQETRYEMSMAQLFDKLPDLEEVYVNRRKPRTEEQKRELENKIETEILAAGISLEKRKMLHDTIDEMVMEDAKYYLKDFLAVNGAWSPTRTTKFSI